MNSILSKETGKSLWSRLAIVLLAAALVLSVVAVSIPGVLRSRMATTRPLEGYRADKPYPVSTDSLHKEVEYGAGDRAGGSGRRAEAQSGGALDVRKVIRTGYLDMVVASPAESMEAVRAIASKHGGWVESAQMSTTRSSLPYAAITIRVPQERFDAARRGVRALSGQIQNDRTEAQDVTGQYVDLEATIKNYRAEEAQYQEIMRRAGTIKDTLQVAERLADVRGRIERAQAQLNVLSRQVAMATLTVNLHVEPVPMAQDVTWHPIEKFKSAFADAQRDLIAYSDFMTVALVNVPVVLLWLLTFVFSATLAWKLVRFAFRRLFPRRAETPQPASA